jgi:SulP family sulfate permease
MRRMAEVTQARLTTDAPSDLPGPLPPNVVLYEISGPLFFGAAQRAMATLEVISDHSQVVILMMDEVRVMDATGLVALESALAQLAHHKCLAILSNVRPQPLALLHKARVHERPGVQVCASADDALAAASAYVARPSQAGMRPATAQQ